MLETTPPGTRRRMDAISIAMYPSQGIQVHGFEVKVSRSDLLSEFEDLTKSGELMQYCTHWWLVCPRDIVSKSELPEGWGLITATKNSSTGKISLRKSIKPVVKKVSDTEIDNRFWRTMLLRLWSRRPEIEERKRIQRESFEQGAASVDRKETMEHLRCKSLEESADLIMEETGIDLRSPWFPPREFWKTYKLARKIEDDRFNLRAVERAIAAINNSQGHLVKCVESLESIGEHMEGLQ